MKIDYINPFFVVTIPYKLMSALRQLPIESVRDRRTKTWTLSGNLDIFGYQQLLAFIDDHELEVTAEARAALEGERQRLDDLAQISDEPLDAGRYELAVMPYGFQNIGARYALIAESSFIADSMGLGKTLQAMMAINEHDLYPALVLCKAALKLNWEKEIVKFFPDVTTQVLVNSEPLIPGRDVYIINYDIIADGWLGAGNRQRVKLSTHSQTLMNIGLKAIVADESHYLKNANSQRSRAALKLASVCDYRIALSGTPILNRTRDLIAQLQWLGLLGTYGGGRAFSLRYCADYRTKLGHEIDDSTDRQLALELNERLTSRCYIMRLKREVLTQLPPKRRATVWLKADNMDEYKLIESDLIAWLGDQSEGAARAQKAMQIVKLNHLRQTAAKGKLKQAIQWIKDFIENGEKLIVFAHHKEIQYALMEAFPEQANLINKTTKQKEVEKARFMEDETCTLIICSVQSDKEGHTLTAASNVCFVELDWTPKNLEQAEDRAHRIGQDNAVTAWYLLAQDTIDEAMMNMLENKRVLIDTTTEGSLFDAVSLTFRGK